MHHILTLFKPHSNLIMLPCRLVDLNLPKNHKMNLKELTNRSTPLILIENADEDAAHANTVIRSVSWLVWEFR